MKGNNFPSVEAKNSNFLMLTYKVEYVMSEMGLEIMKLLKFTHTHITCYY